MKKNISEINICSFLFEITVICSFLFLVFMYGYNAFIYNIFHDEVEHMQASWLIGQGMLPFRDFFEHHHPLLWYITTLFLGDSIDFSVFFGGRIATLLTLFVNGFWIYAISYLLTTQKWTSFFSVFFYLISYITVTEFAIFRPDHMMICMVLGGLFYLLKYLISKVRVYLVISFLFFFLSFCFLQKVILFFFPLGLLCLILLFNKKIVFKDVLFACILPTLLTVLYIVYLYFTHSLKDYFELNWLLNNAWFRNYEMYLPLSWRLYLWGGLLATFVMCFKENNFVRRFFFILVLLYFCILFYMPRPYRWYYLGIVPFLAISWSFFIQEYILKIKKFCWIVFFIVGYFLIDIFLSFPNPSWRGYGEAYERSLTYVLSTMEPQDQLVSFTDSFFVPFHKPVSYYWFALQRGALWDNILFNRAPLPDLNQIVLKQKPRFVRKGITYNRQYTDNQDRTSIMYEPDMEILERYYQQTICPFVYELKEEYRNMTIYTDKMIRNN